MIEFRTALRRVRVKNGGDVTILRPVSANNVVQSLRMLAHSIEVGDVVAKSVIAIVDIGHDVDLYQWGEYDRVRSAGLVDLAKHRIADAAE